VLKQLIGFGSLIVLATTGVLPAHAEDCISGGISAQMESTGPYAGLYKYTIEVSWSSDRGLSHITLDLGLGQCPELACSSLWIFPDPAGTGTGGEGDGDAIKRGGRNDDDESGGDCQIRFQGEFNCKGDPSIDYPQPVLKWDVVGGGCEAGKTGTATLCFYTDIPPSNGFAPTVFNKNGRGVCSGTLEGPIPVICPVSTQPTAWSRIKVIFGTD